MERRIPSFLEEFTELLTMLGFQELSVGSGPTDVECMLKSATWGALTAIHLMEGADFVSRRDPKMVAGAGNNHDPVLYLGDDESDVFLDWDDLITPEYTIEELEVLVRQLSAVAPHIRWRIRWHDHDLGAYPTLAVPTDQFREAEFILDLRERGERLDGYSTEWMYEEIYNVVDGRAVLKDEIRTFVCLAEEFVSLFGEILRGTVHMDCQELASRISALLGQIYALGQKLPFVTDADATSLAEDLANTLSWEMDDWCEEKLPEGWPRFGAFEKYYSLSTPYLSEDEDRIEICQHSLSKDLWEIYRVLHDCLNLFSKKSPLEMLTAIAYWQDVFFDGYGYRWGYRFLQVLSALHFIRTGEP